MGFFPDWNAELQRDITTSGTRPTSMAHLAPKAELSIPVEQPSVHPQIPVQEAVLLCLNN